MSARCIFVPMSRMHLECWRVPSKIWLGLAECCGDESQCEAALLGMNQVHAHASERDRKEERQRERETDRMSSKRETERERERDTDVK